MRLHQDIGRDALHSFFTEITRRFWIESAYFGDHVRQVLFVDLTNPQQRRFIAPAEQLQVLNQCFHRRIEASEIAEL